MNNLEKAGFVINKKKSNLVPVREGKWLGTIINTKKMTFSVPLEKLSKLIFRINNVCSQKLCSAKQLAKIAGYLSSMHMALGPIVRLFTRNLYRLIESRQTWYEPMLLTSEAKNKLWFWKNNLDHINGYSLKPNPVSTRIVFTDASDS